jgi:hypothetical protein
MIVDTSRRKKKHSYRNAPMQDDRCEMSHLEPSPRCWRSRVCNPSFLFRTLRCMRKVVKRETSRLLIIVIPVFKHREYICFITVIRRQADVVTSSAARVSSERLPVSLVVYILVHFYCVKMKQNFKFGILLSLSIRRADIPNFRITIFDFNVPNLLATLK